ncbi:MAG: hypothetical protein JNN15_13930 [Blastocatellia bacterium]|nr:hypothetical protein [Blastocatellia bacterium]
MKKILLTALVLSVFIFGSPFSNVEALAKGKAKPKKSAQVKKKSKNRVKVSVKRGKSNLATKRVALRRPSFNRAAVVRVRALDSLLLKRAEEGIFADDLSGEDRDMRRAALSALGGHPGTVVLMNPNTGQVYSIVNQNWALGKPFKPCSTIKVLTSIAALSEGLVDPDLQMRLPNGGSLNMIEALARSNNEYFQVLGDQIGFDIVLKYAREWGLGNTTGINMAGESTGYLPESKNIQAVPRMCSHGDDIGVTAIQLAVMTAALANGGYIYKPQIIRNEQEKREFKPILLKKVEIAEKNRQKIIEGMQAAVNWGTARRSGASPLGVAGKTGSCNGSDSKVGLFASFLSPENPDLVAVVIATGSSEKGSVSAVIAGEIYNALSYRFEKADRPRRANTAQYQQPVGSSEEDMDEEDDESEETNGSNEVE